MKVIDDIKIAKKLIALENSAKSRGIEFGLTFNRVDNDRGYVDNNVVACSKWFNQMKSNLTVEEIKLLYKGIMKHSK
jgi:phage protein U